MAANKAKSKAWIPEGINPIHFVCATQRGRPRRQL